MNILTIIIKTTPTKKTPVIVVPSIKSYADKVGCMRKVSVTSKTLRSLPSYLRKKKKRDDDPDQEIKSRPEDGDDDPVDEIGGPKFLPTVDPIHYINHKDIQFEILPPLPAQITEETIPLIIKKINLCCLMCDFADPDVDSGCKKAKANTLKELATVFSGEENLKIVGKNTIEELFKMIEINLFRPITKVKEKYLVFDDEPTMTEVNWPHLVHVYTILLKFQQLRPRDRHFTPEFEAKIIFNCVSSDLNEREALLQFLTIYAASIKSRIHPILDKFSFTAVGYVDKHHYPFAITPFLKFYLLQLKTAPPAEIPYLIGVFTSSILPLVKARHIITIYPMLTPIFDSVISKDPSLTSKILGFTVHHWPTTDTSKQIYFLQMVNFLVERLPLKEFSSICPDLFRFYVKCSQSKHHKVADLSLRIWGSVKIYPLILDNTRAIFPIVIEPLMKVMNTHWNQSTQNNALNALKQIHDIDPLMYDDVVKTMVDKKQKAQQQDGNTLLRNWAFVARTAAKNNRDLDLARTLAEIQITFVKPDTKDEKRRK